MIKFLTTVLALMFLTLQYQLWLGADSVRVLKLLDVEVEAQRSVNDELVDRNRLLEIEVLDLKNGFEAVEERARSELGMIGEGETFFLIVD